MGVEYHLLGLPRVTEAEDHPAMAQSHVRGLDRHWHAVNFELLVAPVELVGLSRGESQRDKGLRHPVPFGFAPAGDMTPDSIIASLVTLPLKLLKQDLDRASMFAWKPDIPLQLAFQPGS